jgi:streptogramin lyase
MSLVRRGRVARSRRLRFAVHAGVLGLLAGCGSAAAPPTGLLARSPSACGATTALWVASDYSSSAVGALALSGVATSVVGRVDLGADPALSVSRGRVFFVARDTDALFELDPTCGMPIQELHVHPASHPGSSDPQDVAVARDGSLWVALFDVPEVVILSPSGEPAGTIDLSPYDGDGNPNASAIAIVDTPAGEKAFVALGRLNDTADYASQQPSWMLRVDVATATVETHTVLAGRNPFGAMQNDDGVLWLAEPGNFDDANETQAGVERFDTSTSTSALVLLETDLGGSVSEVSVSGGCGVAIVADATANVNATSLALFDPTTGDALVPASASPLATAGFDLEGLAWSDGVLLVGDRRRASSGYPVHVFDGACAPVERADAIVLPLPPIALSAIVE